MDTLKNEICTKMGNQAWDILTDGIGVPDIDSEFKFGCKTMCEFMRRFDGMTDTTTAKLVLSRVRHGLRHSQFSREREKFARCGYNIDAFIETNYKEDVENFTRLRDTGGNFYGQPITSEVYDFIFSAGILSNDIRKGSAIHITAFPYDIVNYIKETDERKKRYYACHCPFARESILNEGEEVSKTLCYCSLGHAKVMWEAILNIELDGEVLQSVLGGDLMCKYVIFLPDEIVRKYT
ncbi:MAG TPA: hypothetical protein VHT96_04455 [Clostridia bacterium]|nr:hypothetical protein [Clostridia bacterium]